MNHPLLWRAHVHPLVNQLQDQVQHALNQRLYKSLSYQAIKVIIIMYNTWPHISVPTVNVSTVPIPNKIKVKEHVYVRARAHVHRTIDCTCWTSVSAGWVEDAKSPNLNQGSSLYLCSRMVRKRSLSRAITHTWIFECEFILIFMIYWIKFLSNRYHRLMNMITIL